jgi:hypothetical protein
VWLISLSVAKGVKVTVEILPDTVGLLRSPLPCERVQKMSAAFALAIVTDNRTGIKPVLTGDWFGESVASGAVGVPEPASVAEPDVGPEFDAVAGPVVGPESGVGPEFDVAAGLDVCPESDVAAGLDVCPESDAGPGPDAAPGSTAAVFGLSSLPPQPLNIAANKRDVAHTLDLVNFIIMSYPSE